MKRPPLSPVFWVLAVLALAVGAGLVALSAWSRPFEEAREAADAGRLDQAFKRYAATESRFERFPIAKRVLPDVYRGSVASQLWIQYRLRQYDDLLMKAAASPSIAPVHFWAGSALFMKARDEESSESRLGWLNRAAEEFRTALELDPANWDAKYNYELTRRLLDELRKQPKTPPKQMLQLLRPEPKAGGPPGRRVG